MPPAIPLRLAAVLLTATGLVPAGAHLMAMPNKLGLAAEAYLVVQAIYRGWWIGGLFWAAALLANAGLGAVQRRHGEDWRPAAASAVLVALAFAVFLIFTQPANAATANWTHLPPDWQALRLRWEWSHAANAGVLFLALACSARAAIGGRP